MSQPEANQLILLGDSIIDNAAYVRAGEPDVPMQIQAATGGAVDMRAVDGAVTADVLNHQTPKRPLTGAGVLLSSGGNDALQRVDLIATPHARKPIELLTEFYAVREAFRAHYAALLDAILAGFDGPAARVLVLTIYNPRFDVDFGEGAAEAALQPAAEAALSLYNDVIQMEARARGCALIELRALCDADADFANPIEPSAIGGAKIAAAVAAHFSERALT